MFNYTSTHSTIRIGVDIDGCIFDQTSALIAFAHEYLHIHIKESQLTQFDITKTTPLTYANLRYIFNDQRYHDLLQPLPDAQFVLSRLSSWGYWIELVSARYETLYDITCDTLSAHNIPYSMMFLGIKNKALHANSRHLQYFIEDRWKNAENLSKSLTGVFLIDSHWNRDNSARRRVDHHNTIRVGTKESTSAWMEILDYFMRIRQKTKGV